MKDKVLAIAIGLGLTVLLAGCGSAAGADSIKDSAGSLKKESDEIVSKADIKDSIQKSANIITAEEAKTIALEHAGVAAADATFFSVKLDQDDGRQVYEVEFYSGTTEYDYDIDALTGDLIGYDTDIENYSIPSSGQGTPSQSEPALTEQEAIALALAKVPGATKDTIRIHLDYDDGVAVYEGTIIYNEMEYEFEINASDGSVKEWSVESVYDD